MVRESPWIGIACCVLMLGVRARACPSPQEQEIETQRGPDSVDVESTRAIRAATTEASFLTEWVDYVPQSDTVPSPRDFLGYAVGTGAKLSSAERIVAYYRELAAHVTDRVQRLLDGDRPTVGARWSIAAIADARAARARMDEIRGRQPAVGRPAPAPPGRKPRRGSLRPFAAGHVLHHRRAALARDRPPRNGHGAGLPPGGERTAEHVREIRANVLTPDHARARDGRPGERTVDWYNRYLQGTPTSTTRRRARRPTGATTPSTTTIATGCRSASP